MNGENINTDFSNLRIAYLAPELTALEATFVYEELLALEKKTIFVLPVSVRKASTLLVGHDDLLERTKYLYSANKLGVFLKGCKNLFSFKSNLLKGFQWLFTDMKQLGFFSFKTWKLLYQFMAAASFAKMICDNHCTHIHIHFAHVSTQIGMYASALSGVPFTFMAHANDLFERGLLLENKVSRAKKVLTISEYNINFLKKKGVDNNKISIVRCGVKFDNHKIKATKKNNNVFKLGTLGRLVEKKGIDVLIKALSRIDETKVRVILSIAGDGPLQPDLEHLIQEKGLQNDVEFVGRVSHGNVVEWMHQLDGFVLACKVDRNGDQDGIPVVLMEAMSLGIPVISTNLSGIPELVIDGKTGLLAEPDDIQSLKLAIENLVNNFTLRKKLIDSAASHVNSEFGQNINIQRLLNQINS